MQKVLMLLAGGDYVSGEEMSRCLGISRAAIWKKITALREAGWTIEAAGKRGYRLLPGDSLDPLFWQKELKTKRCGQGENRYSETVDSTNTQVKLMAMNGAPDGSLCLAECQTAGRGRLGRSWSSPAGQGIAISVLLRPQLAPAQAPMITLCTAMAMRRALAEAAHLDSAIKWPNDLVVGGKKICGILLEVSADIDRIEGVVIGTGLNVRRGAYPEELKERATSIEEHVEPPFRREIVKAYLTALEEIVGRLERSGFAGILEEYRASSCTIGSRVNVSGSVQLNGFAEDIDDTGALLVRTDDGALHRVLSGDVSVRGVMGYV